jgi:hypothetical protein
VPPAYSIIFAAVMMGFLGYTRITAAVRGSKVHKARLYGLSIFYVVFASYLTFNSFAFGIPLVYIVPYVLVFVGAEYLSNRYSGKTLSFWKTANGAVYAKGGLAIYLVYVAATGARIVISLFFVGSLTALFVYSPNTVLHDVNPAAVGLALIVSEFLLVLGAGLLVGLNRQINLHYNLITQDKETVLILW